MTIKSYTTPEELFIWLGSGSSFSNSDTITLRTKEDIPILIKIDFAIVCKDPDKSKKIFKEQMPFLTTFNDLNNFIIKTIHSHYELFISSESIVFISERITHFNPTVFATIQSQFQDYGFELQDLQITVKTADPSLTNQLKPFQKLLSYLFVIFVFVSVIYTLLIT